MTSSSSALSLGGVVGHRSFCCPFSHHLSDASLWHVGQTPEWLLYIYRLYWAFAQERLQCRICNRRYQNKNAQRRCGVIVNFWCWLVGRGCLLLGRRSRCWPFRC